MNWPFFFGVVHVGLAVLFVMGIVFTYAYREPRDASKRRVFMNITVFSLMAIVVRVAVGEFVFGYNSACGDQCSFANGLARK